MNADGEGVFSTLELRLIHGSHPSRLRLPVAKLVSIRPRTHGIAKVPATRRVAGFGAQPDQQLPSGEAIVIQLPDSYSTPVDSAADGGFRQRLHAAERAGVVRGVPGSDRSHVPGIRLVDPMQQGIGAVMRKAQRAFGIENRHCVDVDVWRHLSPSQLSARHVSPDEVNRIDQKYRCNDPPGLHF
jgi:hypothetical protein